MKKIIVFLYLFIFTSVSLLGVNPPKIPKSILGYGYNTSDLVSEASVVFDDVRNILEPHKYEWDDNRDEPDKGLIKFMEIVKGGYGFLVITAHGSDNGWMQIEDRGTNKGAALLRRDSLRTKFNAGSGEIELMVDTLTGECQIVISPLFLQRRTNLPYSLVFLDGCHSHFFTNAFRGAGSCFGWTGVIEGSAFLRGPLNIFYRTGGRNYYEIEQDVLRNKTVAEALSEYGNPMLTMSGNGGMKLYNSPRIAGVLITQGGSIVYQYGVYGDNPQSYPYEWDYGGGTEA